MSKLVHGKHVEIVVSQGSEETQDYSERTLAGTLNNFEQIDRVYDEEGIAVGKNVTKHWELLTVNPTYPAVGIVPENVISVKEL